MSLLKTFRGPEGPNKKAEAFRRRWPETRLRAMPNYDFQYGTVELQPD
jgi:hypothetical protein